MGLMGVLCISKPFFLITTSQGFSNTSDRIETAVPLNTSIPHGGSKQDV